MIYKSTSGVGFPSCNRALARIPRNLKDPHGYYAELGVDPWATGAEIKTALRRAYRVYHSDGEFPDTRVFLRFKAIGEVLLDPVARNRYNKTPPGEHAVDAVFLQEMEDMSDMTVEKIKDQLPPKFEDADPQYDFLADKMDKDDVYLANEWYGSFINVSPIFRYTGTLKLLLHDGDDPTWDKAADLLTIPRHWLPSDTVAFAIMQCHIRPQMS